MKLWVIAVLTLSLAACQKQPDSETQTAPQAVNATAVSTDTHDHDHDGDDHHEHDEAKGHDHDHHHDDAVSYTCKPERKLSVMVYEHEGEHELHIIDGNVEYDLSAVAGQDAYETESGFDDKPMSAVLSGEALRIYTHTKGTPADSGALLYECRR